MRRYLVHRNRNAATRDSVPYLLDVQSDLLAGLETRVVVPLRPLPDAPGRRIEGLMPQFEVEGRPVIAVFPQMAGIPNAALGPVVTDLSHEHGRIIAALDLLFTGI
ncbi:plasmid maintenance protein CcdB [Chitiniphilus shinanonensis]|uniref:Toxin CcdB n=1 Tax=Chitiniphilus shinanonensis TaxID=553088 RepID=A0ABQ6BN77_9NEIS|nr:CcdB family protein [Chitiniphilus shinanonensis]GLS03336.1 plasmid maintenance protein CcdB [Chitiniphilus shinanonensis]